MPARFHLVPRAWERYLARGCEGATRDTTLLIRRVRGFGAIGLVLIFFAGVVAGIAFREPAMTGAGLGLMLACGVGLALGVRDEGDWVRPLAHTSIGLVLFAIIGCAIYLDGSTPLTVMLPTLLITGTCYVLGVRAAVGWTAVSIAGMALAVVYGAVTDQPPLHRSTSSMIGMGTLVLAGVCAISVAGRRFADQQSSELEFLARHDPLTGLLNRSAFDERVEEALARRRRHDRQIGLVFVDLDGFKAINDEHGHAAGDRLLIELARRIASMTRETDASCRLGGDEFVILLDDLPERKSAALYAERLLDLLMRPVEVDGMGLSVGASLGIATAPDDADDGPLLTRAADHAMYEAKAGGGNAFCLCRPPPQDRTDTAACAPAAQVEQ